MEYYKKGIDTVLEELKTDRKGLTKEEAQKRLKRYGENELKREGRIHPFRIFLSQFKNGLILLLVLAGILSLVAGEHVEAIAIFAIILLNSILGFIQEYRAEKAIEALKEISAPSAKVIRNGEEKKIPAKELVPGDIVVLEQGDFVPADGRIIEQSSLRVDQASLTGESVPVEKNTETAEEDMRMADRKNMAYMGTAVTYGKGRLAITATGMDTELGEIAESLKEEKEVKTPLQKKFAELAKQIGFIAVALIAVVLITGIIQGNALMTMVMFALALTVSTIPNSLPIIVTVSLSMGAKRLAKKNMLIKRLPAAESLGAATVICSDKTGTLTRNEMSVRNIYTSGKHITVTGTGYEPEGEFKIDDKKIKPDDYRLLFRIGILCNNAELSQEEGKWEIIGDPTEGSLVVMSRKAGIDREEAKKNHEFIEELPFDSERKRMTVIYKDKSRGKAEAYVKGAPDLLLERCTHIWHEGTIKKLTRKEKEKILQVNEDYAKQALRVLGLAYKREVATKKKYDIDAIEQDLIFIGLAGMIDPAREEVKPAVEKCRKAGIRVMVITGDHAVTAKAVAKEIGLYKKGDIVLTGEELEQMSDEELEKKIEDIRIIARALPIQKSRIVDALQKNGHIVAMTGDGVNDAPALKSADIGIAMGITGTDVAKEVAQGTLVDDNFATIVKAIEEGRNIYDKMIKSASYLLSCNAGEITTVFMAILLQFPLPLLPLQILLMNLLTDDLPALGLGTEESDPSVMEQPPRDPKEKPITVKILLSIVLFGLIMGAGTLFMFNLYDPGDSLSTAQTVAFTTLVMFQMFAVLSSRTLHHSLKDLNPLTNKWLFAAVLTSIAIQIAVVYWAPLQAVFGTVAIGIWDWAKIVGIASLGFVMMEVSKIFLSGTKKITKT